MIDGDSLAAFVAVARQSSFSRAGDELGVVQSVVSKRLRRLEDQLGTELIDRSVRNNVRLTRIGALYLPEAVEALAHLCKARRIGTSLARGSSGPLRIGFVFSAAMDGTLPRLLRVVRSALPEIVFEPRLMETPEQLEALDAGLLDIGLLRPRPSYPPSCEARVVSRDRLIVCMAETHPLATEPQLRAADLARERFIVPQFREEVGLIEGLRRLAAFGGFMLSPLIRTMDFVTAACMAAAEEGVVLAPGALGRLGLEGIAVRRIADFDENLDIMLVSRKDAPPEAMNILLQLHVGN
jgi:DNA-binding transcriptional LysR family regulator